MTFSLAKVRIFNDNDDDDDDFFLRKLENTMIFRQKNIRIRRILTITMTITITFFLNGTQRNIVTKFFLSTGGSKAGILYGTQNSLK